MSAVRATKCFLISLRNPAGGPDEYEFGLRWLHVKASQLVFVAIYEVSPMSLINAITN